MADTKRKNPTKTTPSGIASWPKVVVPDSKFVKTGEWTTKFLLDPNAKGVAEFLKYLDDAVDAAVAEMKQEHAKYAKQIKRVAAYRDATDKEGNETGQIELTFKRPCQITPEQGKNAGKTFELAPPRLFDAMGTPLTTDPKLGGGSVIKVSFEHWPYFSAKEKEVGITRRLLAVQILKLVQYDGSKDAADYGFEAEEDGFAMEETATTAGAAPASADARDF